MSGFLRTIILFFCFMFPVISVANDVIPVDAPSSLPIVRKKCLRFDDETHHKSRDLLMTLVAQPISTREIAAPLPASVDLRKYCPKVFDQGNLGSCTAQAIVAAIEISRKKRGDPDDTALSRLFVYYNERKAEGDTQEDAGASISDGIYSVIHEGVCREKLWTYTDGQEKFKKEPPKKCYQDALSNVQFLDLDVSTVDQNLTAIKSVLASEKPIVLGISVFVSLMSDEVEKTGIIPLPKPDEAGDGRHAVVLAGYNDAQQQFLLRNSWGKSWGQKGYAWIDYDYILNTDLARDLWCLSCKGDSRKISSSSSSSLIGYGVNVATDVFGAVIGGIHHIERIVVGIKSAPNLAENAAKDDQK